MPTATPHTSPERLFTLRELNDLGYGDRVTLQRRISRGLLPALLVGNRYKIRESDIPLIAKPVGPKSLDRYVDAVIDGSVELTAEQKKRLVDVLAPAL